MVLILMGVSGVGKTTIGTMLSADTGWPFFDADDFHPAANKAKMASSQPLTDEDRAPWLAILHNKVAEYVNGNRNMVLACSAPRQTYRDTLRGNLGGSVQFALLSASPEGIARQLAGRQHEFMNPSLLTSQLAALEQPDDAWVVPVEGSPNRSLEKLKSYLRAAGAII